ncbi:hypothetical protein FQN60_009404, partial [Etheostoma spectabile]
MESRELTEGMPAYCRPMIKFLKSSFWAMLKACWRTKTKSGLKDLDKAICERNTLRDIRGWERLLVQVHVQ